VIGYGVPAVEVNKHSDAVVVYNRIGGVDTFPEARYSAYMSGEPDIRPSALLQAGARPYGDNPADPTDQGHELGEGHGRGRQPGRRPGAPLQAVPLPRVEEGAAEADRIQEALPAAPTGRRR
jgi:hypothetical protein